MGRNSLLKHESLRDFKDTSNLYELHISEANNHHWGSFSMGHSKKGNRSEWSLTCLISSMVFQGDFTNQFSNPLLPPTTNLRTGNMTAAKSSTDVNVFSSIKPAVCTWRHSPKLVTDLGILSHHQDTLKALRDSMYDPCTPHQVLEGKREISHTSIPLIHPT